MLKRKFAAVMLSGLLVLALPMTALADSDTINSPSQTAIAESDDSGASVYVKAENATFEDGGYIKADSTSEEASNVPSKANVVASFEVTEKNATYDGLSMTFFVGKKYAGQTVKIYVEYADGSTAVLKGVVGADGKVSVEAEDTGLFTVALAKGSSTNGGNSSSSTSPTSTDTSDVSPKTGDTTAPVAAGVVVSLVSAAGVAVALRRKVTE